MYCLMTASSNPTILTQYPLAQKCSPVKLRTRPRYSWGIQMPTSLSTGRSHWPHCISAECSSRDARDPAAPPCDQLDTHLVTEFPEDLANILPECAKDCLLATLA